MRAGWGLKLYRAGMVFAQSWLLLVVAGCGRTVGAGPALPSMDNPGQVLPFSKSSPVVIPAGVLLHVRLQQDISNATAYAGETFSALLESPLVVDGQTVAASGSTVNGRVIAARQSRSLHEGGYLRISLSSVSINGKDVPMQTHSLLLQSGVAAPGLRTSAVDNNRGSHGSGAHDARGHDAKIATEVKFSAQSPLTFRLTQPASIN